MFNEMKKMWKLVPYGLSLKTTIAVSVVVVIAGILIEIFQLGYGLQVSEPGASLFDFGALMIGAGCFMPVQMVLSVDVSKLAQASPQAKKLQTSGATLLLGASFLIMTTLLLLMRIGFGLANPEYMAEALRGMFGVGVVTLFLLLYTVFLFKFFWASFIVLYIFFFSAGFNAGANHMFQLFNVSLQISPAAAVTLCYAMVLLGVAGYYALTCAFYKRPFSKNAFGAMNRKCM